MPCSLFQPRYLISQDQKDSAMGLETTVLFSSPPTPLAAICSYQIVLTFLSKYSPAFHSQSVAGQPLQPAHADALLHQLSKTTPCMSLPSTFLPSPPKRSLTKTVYVISPLSTCQHSPRSCSAASPSSEQALLPSTLIGCGLYSQSSQALYSCATHLA